MLIIDESDGLIPLEGRTVRKCRICERRRATWEGETEKHGKVVMCGWCVLYAGSSWGHRNRDEILVMGIQIHQSAQASRNPKTHVPELDERHRLHPEDAEKLMLGIGYTSIHLRGKLVSVIATLRGEEG
jgi:hypothetical protein